MGQEAICKIRIGKKTIEGKVLLESEELIVRSTDLRLKIPFKLVTGIEADGGWLLVQYAGDRASFELGAQAARWAEKIRHPKSRIDKLGIKPDDKVGLAGLEDQEFIRELRARTGIAPNKPPAKDSDAIFFGANERSDLDQLRALEKFLKRDGAIWVVYPKGVKPITEMDVIVAGKNSRLVDVKVASFSPTHTALKLVIPRARR